MRLPREPCRSLNSTGSLHPVIFRFWQPASASARPAPTVDSVTASRDRILAEGSGIHSQKNPQKPQAVGRGDRHELRPTLSLPHLLAFQLALGYLISYSRWRERGVEPEVTPAVPCKGGYPKRLGLGCKPRGFRTKLGLRGEAGREWYSVEVA